MMHSKVDRIVLGVKDLCAGYGNRRVLYDVSFAARQGEIVAIIGPNGAGKSTLLKAIFGLIRIFSGRISYLGADVARQPPHRNVAAGMVFLPQGNRAFEELSVLDNLKMGGYILPARETQRRIDAVLPMYTALKEALNRPAYTLSGGERQMLAVARALILEPRVLLLDEPSVGLSPNLVGEVLQLILQIRDKLDCTILVVEQKVEQVLSIADGVIAMHMGRVAFTGTRKEARAQARELFLA